METGIEIGDGRWGLGVWPESERETREETKKRVSFDAMSRAGGRTKEFEWMINVQGRVRAFIVCPRVQVYTDSDLD